MDSAYSGPAATVRRAGLARKVKPAATARQPEGTADERPLLRRTGSYADRPQPLRPATVDTFAAAGRRQGAPAATRPPGCHFREWHPGTLAAGREHGMSP